MVVQSNESIGRNNNTLRGKRVDLCDRGSKKSRCDTVLVGWNDQLAGISRATQGGGGVDQYVPAVICPKWQRIVPHRWTRRTLSATGRAAAILGLDGLLADGPRGTRSGVGDRPMAGALAKRRRVWRAGALRGALAGQKRPIQGARSAVDVDPDVGRSSTAAGALVLTVAVAARRPDGGGSDGI